MGATRTITRAAAVAASLTLLAACHSAASKQTRRRTPSTQTLPFASATLSDSSAEGPTKRPIPAPLPSAIVRTLSSLREHRLQIVAPAAQSQLLSFGTGRLLQASIDKATFRDTEQGNVITEASIGAVRAVAHGRDGSLFAIGASVGALLEPRAKTAKRLPHVTFLPGSMLLPDLEDPSHFFVYYPEEPQLDWYPFSSESSSILPIEASFRLEGCLEPMTQLRDGAIVCRTDNGFLRQAPRGSRARFPLPRSEDPWVRLLPGMRLDEFFAVSRAGEVQHLRLAGVLSTVAHFRLPAPVYAAVANTDALAFILVSSPQSDRDRRWSLLVTDFDGRPRFESELPSQAPSADEDWLTQVVEDKNLAISAFDPLIAVGGPRRVTVFDYSQARELFRR